MANSEHNALTGSALHDNKGVSTATDNTVATAVSGATVWAKLTASNLTGTGNSFGAQLFHVSDTKAANTVGGSFAAGAIRTRTLNTSVTNEISGSSLSSNQITLPTGTYWVEASAPAYDVDNHMAFFYNVTDGIYILTGTSERCPGSSGTQTRSFVQGRVTIASQKVFELRHQCQTSELTKGLGANSNFSTETYSVVKIWKIA